MVVIHRYTAEKAKGHGSLAMQLICESPPKTDVRVNEIPCQHTGIENFFPILAEILDPGTKMHDIDDDDDDDDDDHHHDKYCYGIKRMVCYY
jgi:hypothetical protein